MNGPIILFFDGHSCHTSIEAIYMAIENEIHLKWLPAHYSHAFQHLDVSIFGPAKKCMNKIVTRFYIKERYSIIIKLRIAKLFKELQEEAF